MQYCNNARQRVRTEFDGLAYEQRTVGCSGRGRVGTLRLCLLLPLCTSLLPSPTPLIHTLAMSHTCPPSCTRRHCARVHDGLVQQEPNATFLFGWSELRCVLFARASLASFIPSLCVIPLAPLYE